MAARVPFLTEIHPQKLLVRGVNWLGDAVMTTPALQRLREHFPETQITLLTSQGLAQLWHHQPSVDSHLTFSPGESPWSVARGLRGNTFDVALVLPNSPRSALEVWLAGVPHRIGYARLWRRWFLTRAVTPWPERRHMRKRSVAEIRKLLANQRVGGVSKGPQGLEPSNHQVYEYLHLAAALGCSPAPLAPKLEVTSEEVKAIQSVLLQDITKTISGEGRPVWLGLNPSAAYGPAKCWPAERFGAVAREVAERTKGAFWLVFGTQADWEVCERITRMAGDRAAANLAGKTSLRELMALLKLCRVVLTNDSGPMHVAAALGTPVVVPFGSTSPELTGPGLPGDPRHRLLRAGAVCSPCFRRVCPIDFRCMTGIQIESAIAAVLDLLHGPAPV